MPPEDGVVKVPGLGRHIDGSAMMGGRLTETILLVKDKLQQDLDFGRPALLPAGTAKIQLLAAKTQFLRAMRRADGKVHEARRSTTATSDIPLEWRQQILG